MQAPFIHLAAVPRALLGGKALLSGVREFLVWGGVDVKQVSTKWMSRCPWLWDSERTVWGAVGLQ